MEVKLRSLCLVILMLICIITVNGMTIPVFSTNGTHYQVGFNIGKQFRSQIQDYYSLQTSLVKKFLPFVQTDAGEQVFAGYLATVRKYYPQYLQELIGMANGAEIPFIKIFSMAIHNELNAHIDGKWKTEHCSDIHLNSQNQVALGHNEDADPLIKQRAFIVNATILENGQIVEEFTAYTYPGNLPGNAFGFTKSGLIFTLNGLYPKSVGDMKIPRNFISRALLGQKSQQDVEKVLMSDGVGSAYAFNLNFADVSKKPVVTVSYEVNSINNKTTSMVSKVAINSKSTKSTGYYYHFNKFAHQDTVNIPQFPDSIVSSVHRRKRAEELPPPTDITGIKNILGDTRDSQYPIYRTPRPTDDTSTTATAIYDITGCMLNIYTDNPKSSQGPVLKFNLPSCSQK